MSIETKHLQTFLEKDTQDMTGKLVAITGTTTGTGYVCARELARLGAKVLLLNRESERARSSLKSLREEVPSGEFEAVACDLQDFASVRKASESIRAKYEVLDVLCNNAGVMAMPDQATKDGYDVQMQTNCISHFLLTRELYPLIAKSADGRIVNHSSMARLGDPLAPEYFQKRGGDLGGDGTEEESMSFSGPRWQRYHQTKLANCAFTYGLVERLCDKGVTTVKAMVAHPGLAATSLQLTTAEVGGMAKDSPVMSQAQTAEDGALGILRCCADPNAKSGDFYGPERFAGYPDKIEPEPMLSDPETIRINWECCEAAVGTFEI
ncbi:MAG: SDR family NAD(P)-dependent oxidoreductase [Myxococcota bacterium]